MVYTVCFTFKERSIHAVFVLLVFWTEMLSPHTLWKTYNKMGLHIVVITTAQPHSAKPELRFNAGSNPALGVSEIRDGEDFWQWSWLEIRLNAFRWSTIPQKQFIQMFWFVLLNAGSTRTTWVLCMTTGFWLQTEDALLFNNLINAGVGNEH